VGPAIEPDSVLYIVSWVPGPVKSLVEPSIEPNPVLPTTAALTSTSSRPRRQQVCNKQATHRHQRGRISTIIFSVQSDQDLEAHRQQRGVSDRAWESRSRAGVTAHRCLPSHERTCINAKPLWNLPSFQKCKTNMQNCWRCVFVNFSKKQECKSNMQNC